MPIPALAAAVLPSLVGGASPSAGAAASSAPSGLFGLIGQVAGGLMGGSSASLGGLLR